MTFNYATQRRKSCPTLTELCPPLPASQSESSSTDGREIVTAGPRGPPQSLARSRRCLTSDERIGELTVAGSRAGRRFGQGGGGGHASLAGRCPAGGRRTHPHPLVRAKPAVRRLHRRDGSGWRRGGGAVRRALL